MSSKTSTPNLASHKIFPERMDYKPQREDYTFDPMPVVLESIICIECVFDTLGTPIISHW